MAHIDMKPADFIAAMRPGADACQASEGIPAGFTIAQAALESGWGTSSLSRAAFNDSRGFARAIAAAGYATDPHYADKLISIIDSHHLEDA